MSKFWRDNGLTVALLLLFLVSIVGQFLTGWHFQNQELARHGEEALGFGEFAKDPLFLSTVFENWESEFLQMSTYVLLTACLFQRGSAESHDPDKSPRDDHLEAQGRNADAPSILRWGKTARELYANSLGITLFILFVASFLLHWTFSAREAASEALSHNETPPGMIEYLGDPQFWFESFQNWQSEFLSTAVLVVLSIFLRQRESPESKAVADPHSKTGA